MISFCARLRHGIFKSLCFLRCPLSLILPEHRVSGAGGDQAYVYKQTDTKKKCTRRFLIEIYVNSKLQQSTMLLDGV